MAVLELPRGVAITPYGAATNRPREYFVVSTFVVPLLLAIWIAISLAVRSNDEAFIVAADWIIFVNVVGFIGLGLMNLPAVRPALRGNLTGHTCHQLTWITAAPIVLGGILGIAGYVNSALSTVAVSALLVASSAGGSHFYSRVMRCLDARPGDYITHGAW
jgi:hypothetical protein